MVNDMEKMAGAIGIIETAFVETQLAVSHC